MSSSRSPLVSAVGVVNILYGSLFIAWGVYCLVAGGEAVGLLLGASKEVKNVAPSEVGQAVDVGAKGLSAALVAMAAVVGGCLIVQGLPLLLEGGYKDLEEAGGNGQGAIPRARMKGHPEIVAMLKKYVPEQ